MDHAFQMVLKPTPEKALELDRLIRESETHDERAAKERLWRMSEYSSKAIADRYHPSPYDLHELANCPADTLGGAYARHMLANQLDPAFFDDVDASSDSLYVRQRIYQTHDIMHCLLEYNTTVLDETGITGFYFGQQDRYHPEGGGLLMVHSMIQESSVFLHAALTDPETARITMRTFIEGYGRGRSAKPFLAFHLEEMWERPIADVRQRLDIVPRGHKQDGAGPDTDVSRTDQLAEQ